MAVGDGSVGSSMDRPEWLNLVQDGVLVLIRFWGMLLRRNKAVEEALV